MTLSIDKYIDERDRDGVVALWEQVFREDPPWNEPAKVIAQKQRFLPELFLVGRCDEVVVSTVVGGYDGVRGWMHHLATHPSHRRNGFARLLVEELQVRLRQLGCVKLNLQVRDGNHSVVAFYERLGFVVEPRSSLGKLL